MPDDEAHSYSHMTATYSPEDNKLRLYALSRLDAETYAKVKAAGFKWAPKQDLFVAPMWTPSRADLCEELAGEIGDEDTSLVDRAEQRADRFEDYSSARTADAEAAHKAVHAIADNIPFGQPILVGHHSEKHARRDAEKIENRMRKAVKMWETANYWKSRAAGAIRAAKYKELPAVRARRIKGLESDIRVYRAKFTPDPKQSAILQHRWNDPAEAPRIPHVWCGLARGGHWVAQEDLPAIERHYSRWIAHCEMRLEYERAMLAASGGTVADQTKPEKGGACRCWASPRGGWSYIQKVNKISVTLLDNWGNGGGDFNRVIPFDKLKGMMSRAEVESARVDGRLINDSPRGFSLLDSAPVPVPKPAPDPEAEKQSEQFNAMRATLKAGVQVVVAPQLFPTPLDVAARIVELANLPVGNRSLRILEPSAGTGRLIDAAFAYAGQIVAVEKNYSLAERLRASYPAVNVQCEDFLECNGNLGKFDRVLMNPPFENGSDIKHIQHAITFLNPGGRLVAICANGPRQNEILQPLSTKWNELPEGTFAGTGVRAVLLTIDEPEGGDL